jgi:chemotaxis signal transduction protein
MSTRREMQKHAARRGEAVILFAVGGTTLAIAATAVEEIRNLEGLQPLTHSPAAQTRLSKVRHVLPREANSYYVVDANLHFRLFPSKPTRVLLLRGSVAAVLVDRIDRMAEISAIYALPRAFAGDERRWYRGLALVPTEANQDAGVVPVVNPDAFLTAAEVQLLDSGRKSGKSSRNGAAFA